MLAQPRMMSAESWMIPAEPRCGHIKYRQSPINAIPFSIPESSRQSYGRAPVILLLLLSEIRMKTAELHVYLPGLPRSIPVIVNILFNPRSNAGRSRIIPDNADRVTDVPRSFLDHPNDHRGSSGMLVRL